MMFLLLCLFVASCAARFVPTLRPFQSDVKFSSESFLVEYEIRNNGDEPASFLPWKTPLDTVWEDIFRIVDEQGNEVAYSGKVARRAPVADHMYTVIAPMQTLKATVDLTRSYLLPRDGAYTISLRNLNHTDAPVYAAASSIRMNFQQVSLQLERYAVTGDRFTGAEGLGTSYTNCNSTQRSNVEGAFQTAQYTQVTNARSCTSSSSGPASACSSNYTTWFGATSSSQYSTIRNCWTNIERDLPKSNYYCCPSGCGRDCGQGIYAYVYPSDSNMVQHLCSVFFDVPNERAETLTHEQSHFTVTCGTNDYTYGRSSCMSLARTDVARAINNADNHCYFGSDVRV